MRVARLAVLAGVAFSSDPEWEQFKAMYKKNYKDSKDEAARYALFKESKVRVAKLNKLNGQAAFGVNWMSDRYEEEKFKKGHKKPQGFVPTAPVQKASAPRSPAGIDWRRTKAVTPTKNQGQCGSCWAFSATEGIESQMILATGAKYDISLSPQQIASCTPSTGTYGCDGCNGGFTEGAYDYLKTVAGLANSFYIPYEQSLTATTATMACPTEKVKAINGEYEQLSGGYVAVTGYSYAVKPCTGSCTGESQDLKGFATALEKAPLSVCVNAGVWNDYTGGVLTASACGSPAADMQDHCVQAVGFNSTAPTPYWIVKNSWATTWGDQGFIYLEMAKNTCGLADDVTIPEVKIDLSEEEAREAAISREAMYQQATFGASTSVQISV